MKRTKKLLRNIDNDRSKITIILQSILSADVYFYTTEKLQIPISNIMTHNRFLISNHLINRHNIPKNYETN